MNFQFMLVKPAESGFSLFLERLFLSFYQFFQCKMHGNSVFSAFWSMNSKFMVNDLKICYYRVKGENQQKNIGGKNNDVPIAS